MSSRLYTSQFGDRAVGRTARNTVRRLRIAPVLVAMVCVLLAVASVTIGQPPIDAPEIIG